MAQTVPEQLAELSASQFGRIAQRRQLLLDPLVERILSGAGYLTALKLGNRGELTMPLILFALVDQLGQSGNGPEEEATLRRIAEALDGGTTKLAEQRPKSLMNITDDAVMFSVKEGFRISEDVAEFWAIALEEATGPRIDEPVYHLSLRHVLAALAHGESLELAELFIELGLDMEAFKSLANEARGRLELAHNNALIRATLNEPLDRREINTGLVLDDAEVDRDTLGRSVLAIGLARRLHRIWYETNSPERRPNALVDARAAFVVQIDAPWGGGKTSFANFVARTLCPYPHGCVDAADFLLERYPGRDLRGIFLDDPPTEADADAWARLAQVPADGRRPWIVVPFNAWRAEDCSPPWWTFYQTIRKHCFEAVVREGNDPWIPSSAPQAPRDAPPRGGIVNCTVGWLPHIWARIKHWRGTCASVERRLRLWTTLWIREFSFRLSNPKVRSLFLTALIAFVLLLLLNVAGFWGAVQDKEKVSSGFILTTGIGLVLAGLTGVGSIWGLGTVLTESVAPGLAPFAERARLGTGDPLDRFREHFQAMMHHIRRPVMVVVDDLDRCSPAFVVDIVRGIQTLLRSSRVVFVILGDRDWIEEAFEANYAAMGKIDVGPEQSLGARFVEKAIQMSFILPAVQRNDHTNYVRTVLLGASRSGAKISELTPKQALNLRDIANRTSNRGNAAPLDAKPIVDEAMEELVRISPDMAEGNRESVRNEVEQLVNDTLSINAAVDTRVEAEIVHQLEELAHCFPPNPRQIKRIVNAITLYYAVALQRSDFELSEQTRAQLALWVILMTEWPETWKLLVAYPDLVDLFAEEDPKEAIQQFDAALLPGSAAATAKELDRILADRKLHNIIAGDWETGRTGFTSDQVRQFAELTPLHRRPRRLREPTNGAPS